MNWHSVLSLPFSLTQWVFIVQMETLWPVVPVSFLPSPAAIQKECRSSLRILKTVLQAAAICVSCVRGDELVTPETVSVPAE